MDQDSSNVNPIALIFLVVMGFIALRGSRSAAVKALLAIASFLPLGQQVVIAGLHFQFFRILILIGFARIFIRREFRGFEFTTMDKLFVGWALAGFICGVINYPGGIMGDKCLGAAFNSFGIYFLLRIMIRNGDEILEQVKFLAIVAILIGGFMGYEIFTHKNLFYVFGGVPEFVGERDGRFRCQGPFRHPILAGTFAATLFPLIVGLWLQGGKSKKLALAAVGACIFSTLVAASSGAIMTCLTAMLGFSLWVMRDRMSLVRRGIVVAIVGLAMTMDAPVYYLIAKLSDVLGGTGWHRSYLLDQTFIHFNEWWLKGTPITAHWAPAGQILPADPNNMDITNHYVAQCIQGGIWRFGLFIAMIVACFKIIGRTVRNDDGAPDIKPKFFWALGVCLACHCTAFISISYFDQIEVFWFWLLAAVAAIPGWVAERATESEESEDGNAADAAYGDPVPSSP
jgi:hypothetical protein